MQKKIVDENSLKELCFTVSSMSQSLLDNTSYGIKFERHIFPTPDDVVMKMQNCHHDHFTGKCIKDNTTRTTYSVCVLKPKTKWFVGGPVLYVNRGWDNLYVCNGIDSYGNLIDYKWYDAPSTDPDAPYYAIDTTGYSYIVCSSYISNREIMLNANVMFSVHADTPIQSNPGVFIYYVDVLEGQQALAAISYEDNAFNHKIEQLYNGEIVRFNDTSYSFNVYMNEVNKSFIYDFPQAVHIPYVDSYKIPKEIKKFYHNYDYIIYKSAPHVVSAVIPNVNCDSDVNYHISNAHYMYTFYNCIKLKTLYGMPNPKAQQFFGMLLGCYNLKNVPDIDRWDMSNAKYIGRMFNGCDSLDYSFLKHWNLSKVKNCGGMLSNVHNKCELDMSNISMPECEQSWHNGGMFNNAWFTKISLPTFTSKLADVRGMFEYCSEVTSIEGLDKLDTTNCTSFNRMFDNCKKLVDLTSIKDWNVEKVTNMDFMFQNDYMLTNLDLSSWNTPNLTSLTNMFFGCEHLTSLDMSHFNFDNVTNNVSMIYDCQRLKTITISHWDMEDIQYHDSVNMTWNVRNLTTINGTITNITYPMYFQYTTLDLPTAQMLIEGLYDFNGNPSDLDLSIYKNHTITFSKATYALLSDNDKETATEKGWTVASAR